MKFSLHTIILMKGDNMMTFEDALAEVADAGCFAPLHETVMSWHCRDLLLERKIMEFNNARSLISAVVECQPDMMHPPLLRDTSFQGMNLRGSDLNNLNLTGCDFTEANLGGVDMSGSIAEGAHFIGANMLGAIMPKRLQRANFESADLHCTDFTGCRLKGAIFIDANMAGVIGLDLEELWLTAFAGVKNLPEEIRYEMAKRCAHLFAP